MNLLDLKRPLGAQANRGQRLKAMQTAVKAMNMAVESHFVQWSGLCILNSALQGTEVVAGTQQSDQTLLHWVFVTLVWHACELAFHGVCTCLAYLPSMVLTQCVVAPSLWLHPPYGCILSLLCAALTTRR